MFLFRLIEFSILIILVESQRVLKWSEEFNGNETLLDHNTWSDKTKLDHCEKQFSQEGKSCNFNNHEISNGTLKLWVKQEKFQGQSFTGATVGTTVCFKDARIEIRAKKPTGAQLHAGLIMYAYEGQCGIGQYRGEIDIAKLRNESTIWSSIHYGRHLSRDEVFHVVNANLNEYQVYGVEWNSTHIHWFINNQVIFQANRTHDQHGLSLNASENPFYLPFDHSFNVLLHVGVASFRGDTPFPNLTDQDISDWMSQRLEVDYIRVYEQANDNQEKLSRVWIITLVIFMVILVVALIISIVLWRKKKTKQDKNEEMYADNIEKDNDYEEYNYNNVDSTYDQANFNGQDYLEIVEIK